MVFKQIGPAKVPVANETDVWLGDHVWVREGKKEILNVFQLLSTRISCQLGVLTVNGMSLDIVSTSVGLLTAKMGTVVAGLGFHGDLGRCWNGAID